MFQRHNIFALFLVILACLLAPRAFAARSDDSREELRRLLSLPQMHWTFGAGFSSFGRLALTGVKSDESEVPQLRQKLKDKPADGELWLKLARALDKSEKSGEASQAASNAVSLLRAQCEQRPNDLHLLVCLGQALDFTGSDEYLSIFRRAVSLGPKNPEAWLALGHCLNSTSLAKLLPEKSSPAQDLMAFLQLMLSVKRPTPAQFEAAEQLQTEAMKAFNTAASLDTNNPEVFERRAGCLVTGGLIAKIKKFDPDARSAAEPPPFLAAFFNPAALPDIRRAAALAQDDPYLLTAATYYEAFTLSLEHTGGKMTEAMYERMVTVLSTEAPAHLRLQLERLNRLAEGPNKTKAAMANEYLGCMQLMPLRQFDKSEASFRRALALDPGRELSWDGLVGVLALQERYADYLAAAQDRLQHGKTARNTLLVAKAYEKLKRRDQELAFTRAALALEPRDLQYHTSVAVALAQQKDTPEAVTAAGEQLARGADLFPKASHEQQVHFHLTRALILALAGEPLAARGALRRVLEADPENAGAKAALAIIQKW